MNQTWYLQVHLYLNSPEVICNILTFLSLIPHGYLKIEAVCLDYRYLSDYLWLLV